MFSEVDDDGVAQDDDGQREQGDHQLWRNQTRDIQDNSEEDPGHQIVQTNRGPGQL